MRPIPYEGLVCAYPSAQFKRAKWKRFRIGLPKLNYKHVARNEIKGTKGASNCLQTPAVFVSSRADFITSCFHGLSCLIIAFSIVNSFLMQATKAAFFGLPAATSR